jgi:hypothetical protein
MGCRPELEMLTSRDMNQCGLWPASSTVYDQYGWDRYRLKIWTSDLRLGPVEM